MKAFISFVAMVVLAGCANSSGQQPQPKTANKASRSLSVPAESPKSQTNLPVQVSGYVKQSGSVAWTNGMTLTDAIASAGGFTGFANRREVKLGRSNEWFGYFRFIASVEKGSAGDPPLKPGDIVWVPPNYFSGKPVEPTPRPPSALPK